MSAAPSPGENSLLLIANEEKNLQTERDQTDASLRAERDKTKGARKKTDRLLLIV